MNPDPHVAVPWRYRFRSRLYTIAGGYPSRTSKRFSTSRPALPLPSRNGCICSKRACTSARRRQEQSTAVGASGALASARSSLRREREPRSTAGGRIPAGERLDVVLGGTILGAPGRSPCGSGCDLPHKVERELVYVTQVGDRHQGHRPPTRPVRWRGHRPESAALAYPRTSMYSRSSLLPTARPCVEQLLDLLEDEGVPLDRCRMVGLLEPDAAPDALRLERRRADHQGARGVHGCAAPRDARRQRVVWPPRRPMRLVLVRIL